MAARNRRFTLGAIALPLFFLLMSAMARAATITVDTLSPTSVSGHCNLSDAITAANTKAVVQACTAGSGTDTIEFSVTGTITLTSELPAITNTSPGSLTIDGSGQAITVDGAGMFQIFDISSGTLGLRFLTLAHGTVIGNEEGLGAGGAVFNEGGTLTVTNCTFSDNQSTGSAVGGSGNGLPGQGGAIYNSGALTVTDSTFSGNGATGGAGATTGVGGGEGEGGAIYNDSAMTVINSTFSANQATGGVGDGADSGDGVGGAINNDFGTGTVTNSTFSGNKANAGSGGGGAGVGGAIDNEDGTLILKSTILAASTGGNCADIVAVIGDAGYNISDDNSCGFSGTSINNSTTLHLDPAGLANNGGPTQTIALEPNSQAIDFIPVADCTDQSSPTPLPVTTDQRGYPRPDLGNPDFCDAGAFELQTMPFVLAPNSERLQIARSSTPYSDQVNMAFTFTENGFPSCDAGDNAFNGFTVLLRSGRCEALDDASLELMLEPWVVHTVNHQSYGTIFQSIPRETVSARMVALPTPASPACGEWTVNIEVAGIDSYGLGNGPFALVLTNPDGDTGCFDITNAIVGNQIPTPSHSVRRGVRRQTRR